MPDEVNKPEEASKPALLTEGRLVTCGDEEFKVVEISPQSTGRVIVYLIPTCDQWGRWDRTLQKIREDLRKALGLLDSLEGD